MDKIGAVLRNSIINETAGEAIVDIVGNRIHPAQIAAVIAPVYPCLNYEISLRPEMNAPEAYVGSMRLWCWSGDNEDADGNEAWRLFRLVMDYWHENGFQDSVIGRSVKLAVTGEGIMAWDEEAQAHAVVSQWNIFGARI